MAALAPASGEVMAVQLSCRGVNLSNPPEANGAIAYALIEELKARTNYVDAAGTTLTGNTAPDQSELTFTFEVTLKLKRPLKL
jgi:hypothetical protein